MAHPISGLFCIGNDSLTKFLFWQTLNVQILYPLKKYKNNESSPQKEAPSKLSRKFSNIKNI